MGPLVDGFVGLANLGKEGAIKLSDKRAIDIALTGRPYTEAQRRALEGRLNAAASRAGALPAATAGAIGSNTILNPPR